MGPVRWDTPEGLAEAVDWLLATYGLPHPHAGPTVWVLSGWRHHDNLTGRPVDTSGVELAEAIARTPVNDDDRAIVLLSWVRLGDDGALPWLLELDGAGNSDALLVYVAGRGGAEGVELLAAFPAKAHQAVAWVGRRRYPVFDGQLAETILQRLRRSLAAVDARYIVGDVYGRFCAARLADLATGPRVLAAIKVRWSLGRVNPDLSGPGVPIPEEFKASFKAKGNAELARAERVAFGVELGRRPWSRMQYRPAQAVSSQADPH